MLKKSIFTRCLLVVLFATSFSAFSQTKDADNLLLYNAQYLSSIKKQYNTGDATTTAQINLLIADADKALTTGPFSVTLKKTKTAPNGNPHDYMSQAPYWWADPSKPDGKPYIRKDGERNPEIYQLNDASQMHALCQTVKILGFAYYFTGKEQYAEKAASLMNTWFIAENTKMAPNLNYAQYVPGINDGRGIGIIESRALSEIPDALGMMQDSKSITGDLKNGVKQWFAEYLNWLQTSKNGKDEKGSQNNHGTYYDMQVVDFAIFCGNEKLARTIIQKQTIARMDKQFTIDGKQPLELERTKSWGYANMNLYGWCKLAMLADHLGIDLWHTEKDGRSIKKCIEWLMRYLLKEKEWPYKQIEPMNYAEALGVCSLAESKYPDIDFQKAFKLYSKPNPWM